MIVETLQKTYFLTTAMVSQSIDSIDLEEILSIAKVKVDPLESQKDLMKIVSVLVSTGINKNDDVFLPEEILPVRNTGAHKPLNLEHDAKQIVGHMLRTYAALKDGTILDDDESPDENEFDIIAEAVLYKFLFPDLAEDIKQKAKANKLFVSIEAWFTAYDFLVGSKVVKRNAETSALLDPVLKMNGGKGIYENQRVGRVLRNMIIGGIGLVKVPANTQSIIKSVSSLKDEVVNNDIESITINNNIIGDIFQLSVNNLREDKTMNEEVMEEIAQVIAAQRAAATVATTADTTTPEDPRLAALELKVRELTTKLEASEHKAELAERANVLRKIGLSEEFIISRLSDKFFADRKDFDSFVDILTAAVAEIKVLVEKTVKAEKVEKAEEKAIGGGDNKATVDNTQTTVNSQVTEVEKKVETPKETPKVETTKVEVPKTEVKETVDPKAAETKETQDLILEEDTEDVISLEDLDLVDKEVKVETDTKTGPSLTDQMADIISKFLKGRNDKWSKLEIK